MFIIENIDSKFLSIGNIMDSAVQTVLGGVDTLMDNVPHGCGEQTMILMAPIVYAMRYLHGTGGITPRAENKGKFFMKVGKDIFVHIGQ